MKQIWDIWKPCNYKDDRKFLNELKDDPSIANMEIAWQQIFVVQLVIPFLPTGSITNEGDYVSVPHFWHTSQKIHDRIIHSNFWLFCNAILWTIFGLY